MAKIGIRLGKFPPEGQDVPLSVTLTQGADQEQWHRDFDGRLTRSTLRFDPVRQQIVERLGYVTCGLVPRPDQGVLHVDVSDIWLMGLRAPRMLVPRSFSKEWQGKDGTFRFDVGAHMPGGGLLIRYQGWLVTQV